MLDQRLRRWPNIKPTLSDRIVIADISVSPTLRHPIALVGDADKYMSLFHGKQIIIDNPCYLLTC